MNGIYEYKADVAVRLFPGITPSAARKQLNILIAGEPKLQETLRKLKYKKRQKRLTRRQIEAIEDFL